MDRLTIATETVQPSPWRALVVTETLGLLARYTVTEYKLAFGHLVNPIPKHQSVT